MLLPEPKLQSLEEATEYGGRLPTSAIALGEAESRGTRIPPQRRIAGPSCTDPHAEIRFTFR